MLAYDVSQHGTLTFNTLTGAFDLRLDEGPGIVLKAGDLEAVVAGRSIARPATRCGWPPRRLPFAIASKATTAR